MTTNWLILTATLPTTPSGLRVRVWRALKATGRARCVRGFISCRRRRPAPNAAGAGAHDPQAGAEAHLALQARDDEQEQAFRSLFDRSALYAELVQAVKQVRAGLRKSSGPTSWRCAKSLRALEAQRQACQAGLLPRPRQREPPRRWARCAGRSSCSSPDEPVASQAAIPARAMGEYQGRTWATRKRSWVDRLATAWLIQRFIDKRPSFIWLATPGAAPSRHWAMTSMARHSRTSATR